jgi:uncharacterized 2Fe-2S/4Fe-4S cluster protein (DUF4445 family)
VPLITVIQKDTRQIINTVEGKNLLTQLQEAGFYVPALCGGRETCGKCRVKVLAGSLEISDADRAHFSKSELAEGYRLACAVYPRSSLTISISDSGEEDFSALAGFKENMVPGTVKKKVTDTIYAIAVDIGTTTLAFALLDCGTGNVIASLSMVNKQREFGADVISRIQRANAGDLGLLCRCVREQISAGIESLCRDASIETSHGRQIIDPRQIREVAIAGNTTMLHLLFNLSCRTLAQAPFTPVSLEMVSVDYKEIFNSSVCDEAFDLNCKVTALPGISAYVGADIVSGILFSKIDESSKPAALMDIGTNGEMALSYGGKIICTATAAGPAFEGGNILWGTGSVQGAISQVTFCNGVFEIATIGNKSPVGICGSAVVDIVYQGLKNSLILPNGRFNPENNFRSKNNFRTENGMQEIVLAKNADGRDIVFCQKDVRELQLAKSAIRSGFDALLNHAELSYDDLDVLYIAGGFGFNLNLESAAGIGLIPKELVQKISVIGNSALGGAAAYLLNPLLEERLKNIARDSEEFNLPGDRFFSEQFISNMDFEVEF